MQNTSSTYLTEIKKPSRSFECKVTIGDKIYTNSDVINITIEDVQASDGFYIGSTVSKSLEITLSTNNTIYSNSVVKVEIGLDIGSTIEYILIGYFNIDDIERTDYSIKLICYDNMIKFEKSYFSSLGETSSLKNIVNELSQITGVEFTGSLPSYTLNKLEGFTCREILGFVASICGGNAYITREGKFTIKTPVVVDYSITDDNYIDLTSEEDLYKIGAVTCKSDDKEITKGTISNSTVEIAFENPWVNESILTEIYNKLKDFQFIGYSMKWQGDFSLDVGDIISITDTKGVTRQVPILSQKFNYNGGLTSEIGAKGESKTKNEFSSTGNLNNKINRIVTDLLLVNEALINKADIGDLKAVNAEIENLIAENVTITGKLSAIEGEFGTLKANVGVIDQLVVNHSALINDLQANKANITDLTAINIKFDVASGGTLDLQTLLSKFVTGENGQFINISSSNSVIANATIKNAMIESLSLDKLLAGTISTTKFNISSDDGGINIVGPTMQFKDKSNNVRLQLGQDTAGDFNFILKAEDGATTLIDGYGITENAIADDLIKENMVAADAIGEKQINYSSFITGLNKDTNTQLIKASKVAIDLTGQSLEVAFNSLKTNVDGLDDEIEANTTAITVAQGKIDGLISETSIIKGDVTTISDKYTSLKATVDGISTTVASHTSSIGTINTNISGLEGKVTTVENKYTSLSQDLSGFKTTVGNTYSTKSELSSVDGKVTSLTSRVSTAESSITQLNNKIALKVEATDVTEAINNISIGVRNLVRDTSTTLELYAHGGSNENTGSSANSNFKKDPYKLISTSLSTLKNWKAGDTITFSYNWEAIGSNLSGNFKAGFNANPWEYTTTVVLSSNNTKGRVIHTRTLVENDIVMSSTATAVRFRMDNIPDGTIIKISNLKVELGNKATDWTPAPEDVDSAISTVDSKLTTTNNKVATIENNLSSITSRVSSTESSITTINGNVTSLQSRMSSAEQKITDSAIISTVTSSTTYKNDLTGKVSSNSIISSINQTAETIKIDASKIQLTGEVICSAVNSGSTTINGDKITTGSILADKIAIGDFNNYVILKPNATFTGTTGTTEGYEICSISGSEKYNNEHLTNKLNGINAGDKFRVKGMMKSNTAGSILEITCCWRDANGSIVSTSTTTNTIKTANTWQEINLVITIPNRPTNAAYVRFKININSTQYRRIYVEGLSITRMASGELIVDGAITAEKLSATAIDGKTITGNTIVGGAIRGSSNFYTAPNSSALEGYAFRIYSTGELYSGGLINVSNVSSPSTKFCAIYPDGYIHTSNYINAGNGVKTSGQSLWLGIRDIALGSSSNFNIELTQQDDKNVYLRPGYNGQAILGHSAYMWNKVYAVNGVSSSSDRTLKENIKYLAETENTRTTKSSDLTESDLYNFVRDDLVTATYNFIGDDREHIGFIAQDLLYNIDGSDNKVGQLLINKPDDERSPLSYNEKIYSNILAGALRHAILKIEELEMKIKVLESN